MYATCTFCHRSLGSNESIEVFPVGQRLAYDASKGRSWVVCPHCAQWNLSPLEERWEAIDGAERLFRECKLRHSTENIGLARLRDGMELLRIGKPLRPEMAAWRYGRNFMRRWTGMAVGVTAGIAAGAGVGLGVGLLVSIDAMAAGVIAGTSTALTLVTVGTQVMRVGRRVAFVGRHVLDNEHQYVLVSSKEVCSVRLVGHESGWALRVPYLNRRPALEHHWKDMFALDEMGIVTISGHPAVTAARQLLPFINGFGARQRVVEDAVLLAATWSNSSNGFAYGLARLRELAPTQYFGDPGALNYLPQPLRLALEMSVHEEEEQRALDGELAELEHVWREAEIVAEISDGLIMPGRVQRALDQLRGRNPLA